MVVKMTLLLSGYCLLVLVSLILAIWSPIHLVTALVTACLFVVLTVSVPVQLGWSRGNFGFLVSWFVGSIFFGITIFAIVYWRTGLNVAGAHRQVSFQEAMYFSVTTWTTLGYGDYTVARTEQIVTSVEALTGYFAMGVFVAFVALWFAESLKDYDTYIEQLPQLAQGS